MKNFSLFIEAFRKRNFYILGAGASFGLIPFTSEQGALIVQRHQKFGCFSAKELDLDAQAKRIIGSAYNNEDNLTQELIRRLPSGAVRLISAKLMTLSKYQLEKQHAQYAVFNIAQPQSVIFNFNVDGLAYHYCKKHYVLHPHGTLNSHLLQSDLWEEIIDHSLMYHSDPKDLLGKVLLPEPEYSGITKGIEYQKALSLFRYSTYVIIIGYSFGYDGNRIDDWESFEFLKNLFLYYKVPILIVDPYPEKLAYKLREELKHNKIYEVKASWEILSKAIIELKRNRILHPHEKNKNLFDIYYLYCKSQNNKDGLDAPSTT